MGYIYHRADGHCEMYSGPFDCPDIDGVQCMRLKCMKGWFLTGSNSIPDSSLTANGIHRAGFDASESLQQRQRIAPPRRAAVFDWAPL